MTIHSSGNLVILSTYPIAEARHGGQLRVANMKRAYETAGWAVTTLAVYQAEAYGASQVGSRDVPFPMSSTYRRFAGQDVPFIADLQTGAFAVAADGGFDHILDNLPTSVAVFQVEHPWLWPLVAKLRQRPEFASSLAVYSSHNIETPLKEGILAPFENKLIPQAIEAVEAAEKRAAREADLTIAVSADDAKTLRKWGARQVVVAPNGIAPWQATENDLRRWRERLPAFPWLLYIASGHPPNYSHFLEIFGGSLACFPPTSRLVVVGGVCEPLYHLVATSKWNSLNLSRLQLLHQINDEDLAAVRSLAHGFILPIPFGGGTNIKTAEALFSGKHVVGTQAAFRGYEHYLDLPGVVVSSTAQGLQAAIRKIILMPPKAADNDPTNRERRQSLRWDKSLERAVQAVDELTRRESARG
ncbi:glycosyltransferase [Phreatobacter sp. AB_2022a]|uniref:glycosyltransferase n=1 Tax=Phreatobacter sp. AB_2022a TaxID=3003134 RepID=UPI0022871B31|nr:glycosyltransferase [Phreatobacter sp. AB_2022a]MCZ0733001.1 hypothetical protein [Phreatobacter sp. AB_2022a]